MENGCLICGKPLVFSQEAEERECYFCHRKFPTNAVCEDGHFVCDECHARQGIKSIIAFAKSTPSRNPIEIAMQMMSNPFIYMHGNEHHVLVGAALLAAYHNAGGKIDLDKALVEIEQRGLKVPGGACGFWGSCGAGISSGMFIAIVTGSTPLKNEEWGLSNRMTSESLKNIGGLGGPRCCKRNTFTAIKTAVAFCSEHLGADMELPKEIVCPFSLRNRQCIAMRCPYFTGNHEDNGNKI